jgi:hypothetical protein
MQLLLNQIVVENPCRDIDQTPT